MMKRKIKYSIFISILLCNYLFATNLQKYIWDGTNWIAESNSVSQILNNSDLNSTLSTKGTIGQSISTYDANTNSILTYTYVNDTVGWIKSNTNSGSNGVPGGTLLNTSNYTSINDLKQINNPTSGQTVTYYDNNLSSLVSMTYVNSTVGWKQTPGTSINNSNSISLSEQNMFDLSNKVADVMNGLYFNLDGTGAVSGSCTLTTPCNISSLTSLTSGGNIYIKIKQIPFINQPINSGNFWIDIINNNLTIDLGSQNTLNTQTFFRPAQGVTGTLIYNGTIVKMNYPYIYKINKNIITSSKDEYYNLSSLCINSPCNNFVLPNWVDNLNVDIPLKGSPALSLNNNFSNIVNINITNSGYIYGGDGDLGSGRHSSAAMFINMNIHCSGSTNHAYVNGLGGNASFTNSGGGGAGWDKLITSST